MTGKVKLCRMDPLQPSWSSYLWTLPEIYQAFDESAGGDFYTIAGRPKDSVQTWVALWI